MMSFSVGSIIDISKGQANAEEVKSAKAFYAENNYVLLNGFFEIGLLNHFKTLVENAVPELFFESSEGEKHGKGHVFTKNKELQLSPNILMNQNKVIETLKEITSEKNLKSAVCYVYRTQKTDRHALHWHQDTIEQKLFVVSVNLSTTPYEGGEFALRQKSTQKEYLRITNNVPGRMILARIGEDWEHETTKVTGDSPRITMAGWGVGHEWREKRDLLK